MSSRDRQTHLHDFGSGPIAINKAQRSLVCAVEDETPVVLVLPYRRPRVASDDKLKLVLDDDEEDWSTTVEVIEAPICRVDGVPDIIDKWDATYWGYDDRIIAESVSNIYGEIPRSTEVVALVILNSDHDG